jgi:hypothetical protein
MGISMGRFWWILPVLLLASLPAAARPRDDALAGAFRCAGIADSRQWLDCYYGAAQPVRAALKLAPALAAQVQLAQSPPGGGVPRDEAVRDDVMSGAAACIRAPNERAWLDCYYAAATPMRAQLGLSVPAGAARIAAPPPPRPLPQMASTMPPAPAAPVRPAGPPPMPRSGGFFTGLLSEAKPVVRSVPMQSFSFNRHGGFVVTLADGEVWEQMEEDEVYHPAHWNRQPSQMLVTISPAVMRTFSMKVAGEYGIYKVRRVR